MSKTQATSDTFETIALAGLGVLLLGGIGYVALQNMSGGPAVQFTPVTMPTFKAPEVAAKAPDTRLEDGLANLFSALDGIFSKPIKTNVRGGGATSTQKGSTSYDSGSGYAPGYAPGDAAGSYL